MQYTRVVIVASVAALVARFFAAPGGGAAVGWLAAPAWGWLAVTLALAVGCVTLGRRVPLPSAPLLLPLILGTLLQNLGLLRIELPPMLLAAAYAAIGWGVGLRFDRRTVRHAARALPAVLLSIVCLVTLCAGFAALLVVFAGFDPLTAYLAMSPGGADTVAIIASSTPVDVAFVMAMQTARLIFVLMTGPVVARFVAGRVAPARG
jgi:membrane AbrB-like protein